MCYILQIIRNMFGFYLHMSQIKYHNVIENHSHSLYLIFLAAIL